MYIINISNETSDITPDSLAIRKTGNTTKHFTLNWKSIQIGEFLKDNK